MSCEKFLFLNDVLSDGGGGRTRVPVVVVQRRVRVGGARWRRGVPGGRERRVRRRVLRALYR